MKLYGLGIRDHADGGKNRDNNSNQLIYLEKKKYKHLSKAFKLNLINDKVTPKTEFLYKDRSTANPTPTLCLGYELEAKKSRRNLFRHPIPLKSQKLDQTGATNFSTFMTVASEQPPYSKDYSTDLDKKNNLTLAIASFFSPVSDHSYCSIQ